MQKLTLPLVECLPGMIVAESIRNRDNGVIYVSQDQELTAEIIDNLRNFKCHEVSIYVNSWDTVWKMPKETFESYDNCTDTVKPLLQQIAAGQSIDLEAFKAIKNDMLGEFKDNFKIIGCINVFKFADKYTYTHSINVGLLSMLIGKWMKYGENMVESLLLAGILHDIGKMKIDAAILNKPGALTPSEFEEMKKHPRYSYEILQHRNEINMDIKVGILMHHERIDGSGYPYAIYNENINDIGRVLAVADVYDAMMSERPYKKKHSPFEVMQLMQEGAFGKLDTKILLTFLTNVANYYVGVYVLLSTGEVGQVIAINPSCVYRPIIKVKDKYIDLFTEKTINIIEVT